MGLTFLHSGSKILSLLLDEPTTGRGREAGQTQGIDGKGWHWNCTLKRERRKNMRQKHQVIFDCDQCGTQFPGYEDECPKPCPGCDRHVNFILEPDDFRVNK